jgi:hypothetical protein
LKPFEGLLLVMVKGCAADQATYTEQETRHGKNKDWLIVQQRKCPGVSQLPFPKPLTLFLFLAHLATQALGREKSHLWLPTRA